MIANLMQPRSTVFGERSDMSIGTDRTHLGPRYIGAARRRRPQWPPAACSIRSPSVAGGKVLFATDDFFAVCENMLSDSEPIFIPEKYTEYGKWMDGWETRRKRTPGHDWCILKLATKCVIRGVQVDTAFFTGNYAPKYSVQAACLSPQEEALLPKRQSRQGTTCDARDLQQIELLVSERWEELIPKTPLRPGYEHSRHNYQKVVSDEAWTHIRVNMYPDGGIARLRVFGEARPAPPLSDELVDLASMLSGGVCQGFSNAHYGHPRNTIKPGRGVNMGDGWETARRLDRPEVLRANADGTLSVPGEEWAVYKLGYVGEVVKVCVDTRHFKGNFPDSIRVEGARLETKDWAENQKAVWFPLVNTSKLTANSEHWFECQPRVASHVRVTMAPDGGISRVRVMGYVTSEISTS
ncbi:Allantoicase [Eumeta japonica]|uniref:Allantoate amidinohydrolase n=1 Tax=Eumeta variegata TaxID=151549 RepID=A0A4C1STI1_EUMVA|nr:Allantoicase [Eumeta japonica]